MKHEYYPGGEHGYSQILFGGKIMLHPASMIKRDVYSISPMMKILVTEQIIL